MPRPVDHEVPLRDQTEPPQPPENPLLKEALAAAFQPAAAATRHDITLGQKDFDKLDKEGAELLKKHDVTKISIVAKGDADLIVVERKDELQIPLDPSLGCRKITVGAKLAGEFVQKPDGSMEIRNLRGLKAEVDPGKDPYLGISLPWVTADVSKIALTKGADGKFTVEVSGNFAGIQRSATVPLSEEQLDRVKSVLTNLEKLRTQGENKPVQKLDVDKLMEGVPAAESGNWINSTLKIAGATLTAIAAAKAGEMAYRRRTSGRNRGPADDIIRADDRGKVESKGDAAFVTDRAPSAEVRQLLEKWKGEEKGLEKDLERAVAKMPESDQRKELEKQIKALSTMEEGAPKDAVRRAMAEMVVESRRPGFNWDSAAGRALKVGGAAGTVIAIGMLVQLLMKNESAHTRPQSTPVTPDFGKR